MKKIVLFLSLIFAGVCAVAGFRGFQSTTSLGLFSSIKCGSGLTCTRVGNDFSMISSPVLAGNVTLTAANGADIKFILNADNSDDSGDEWTMMAAASGNALSFSNDTSGSVVQKFAISTAGVLTLSDSETITNASDAISLGFDDAAANVNVVAFEATNSNITLKADESDDNGDDWMLSSVASSNVFTISNDTTGSQVAKLTMAASDGDITLTGGITGDGGDTVSGFLQKQTASTTVAITATQCGETFVSNSADVMQLPEASTVLGCRLTFISGTADDFDINPADGTDQILPITASGGTISPSAGDAIRITDPGSSVTLEAIGANAWAARAHNGVITDVN